MNVSKEQIVMLKKETGAGLSDCINAIKEANGDLEKAKSILRKKGYSVLKKREEAEVKQGYVNVIVDDSQKKGVIYLLACETDFVAKCEPFKKTVEIINEVISSNFPNNKEQLLKIKTSTSLTVEELLVDLAGKVGEKISLEKYFFIESEYISYYVHYGNTMGSLVAFKNLPKNMESIARELAIHVTAMKPLALSIKDLPPSLIENERKIIEEELSHIKDENIKIKAIEGKLQKILANYTLFEQPFALDENKTVREYIMEKNFTGEIVHFIRVSIGE